MYRRRTPIYNVLKSLPFDCINCGHTEIRPLRKDSFNTLLQGLGGERRINYALDRFQSALKAVGNPEKDVHTLVIAGTNGKGPPLFLFLGLSRERDFVVCTYLSPHLQTPTGSMEPEPNRGRGAGRAGARVRGHGPSYRSSYFEFLTLLSFIWAKRRGADIHVLEVGLGGRLDATNVTDPLACAITNISL